MTTDILMKLRDWLTLDEAASELSTRLNEHVTAAKALRLALDGHLKLSVHLPTGTEAICSANDREEQPTLRQSIEGLWELPMVGAGRQHVEREFNRLSRSRRPLANLMNSPGALVQRANVRCHLLADRGGMGINRNLAPALPADSRIVVGRGALDAFVARISEPSTRTARNAVATATCEDVTIEFTSEERVRVRAATGTSTVAPELADGTHIQTLTTGPSRKVGGPKLAAWLKSQMEREFTTVSRLHVLTGLDRKTIKAMLAGKPVRQVRVEKLASGLAVARSDIPTD